MEEIARLAGYNTIASTYPQASAYAELPDAHLVSREAVRGMLAGYGFAETITYSFISESSLAQLRLSEGDRRTRPLRLHNPLSEDQAVMRTSLLPGLLATTRRNLDYRNMNLRIYELSKVFLPTQEELPEERYYLAGFMSGMRHPQLLYAGEDGMDYTDVKGVVEALLGSFHIQGYQYLTEPVEPYLDPWAAAAVFHGSRRLGVLGRLHPEVQRDWDLKTPVFLFELDYDLLYQLRGTPPRYRPLPKFPSVTRDMALVVDVGLPVQRPMDFVAEQHEPLLEQVEVFDLYRHAQLGQGKKSVGYRLVYRAPHRNLTDEEVNSIHAGLVENVLAAFQATLR